MIDPIVSQAGLEMDVAPAPQQSAARVVTSKPLGMLKVQSFAPPAWQMLFDSPCYTESRMVVD